MRLYHGTNYSSAVNINNNGIKLEYSKRYLDFGPGFYTTPSFEHAVSVAIRTTQKYNARHKTQEEPYIVEVDFRPVQNALSTVSYPRHSEKWGRFVLSNRLTPDMISLYNIEEHNQDARYDICCGEIADGSIVNIAYQVNNRIISLEDIDYHDFLKKSGEVYPQQYSFHTLKALSCINVLGCGTIKNKQKYIKLLGRR